MSDPTQHNDQHVDAAEQLRRDLALAIAAVQSIVARQHELLGEAEPALRDEPIEELREDARNDKAR